MEEEKKINAVEVEPGPEMMQSILDAQENPDNKVIRTYLCEVCGKEEELTEKQALNAGWDYPPFIGWWRILSPRTCGDCGIEQTAYWHVIMHGTENLPENHLRTIQRILEERPPATDG